MSNQITGTLLAGALMTFAGTAAQAGCPCESGGGIAMPAPMMMAHPAGPDQMTAAPPLGTIGRTYQLPSRDIPADKHPRIAMLDIIAPTAVSVRVVNVYVHREEDDVDGFEDGRLKGLWRFETLPLIPGNPHIYKIIFRFSEDPLAREEVRYVRLIPGRILEYTY